MAVGPSVTSNRFPYIVVRIIVRSLDREVDALLDTGFDGFLALPAGAIADAHGPDNYLLWTLADGSEITAPAYLGTIQIGTTRIDPAVIIELGNEPILGLHAMERFKVILDHGRQVIFES
jgi:predicted aspartyl protease